MASETGCDQCRNGFVCPLPDAANGSADHGSKGHKLRQSGELRLVGGIAATGRFHLEHSPITTVLANPGPPGAVVRSHPGFPGAIPILVIPTEDIDDEVEDGG